MHDRDKSLLFTGFSCERTCELNVTVLCSEYNVGFTAKIQLTKKGTSNRHPFVYKPLTNTVVYKRNARKVLYSSCVSNSQDKPLSRKGFYNYGMKNHLATGLLGSLIREHQRRSMFAFQLEPLFVRSPDLSTNASTLTKVPTTVQLCLHLMVGMPTYSIHNHT